MRLSNFRHFYFMIGIYKITSPKNKIYIGQSINIERRFKTYKNTSNSKNQIKLNRSFIKYGVENHVFEIIEECSKEKLQIRERYWQEYYNVLSSNGLNLFYASTENTKTKVSDESRKKMSLNSSKHFKGKKHTLESKIKISLARKGTKASIETRLKLSEIRRNKPLTKKQLDCIDRWKNSRKKIILNTQTGIYYFGIKEASISANINKSTLTSYLNGQKRNKTEFISV